MLRHCPFSQAIVEKYNMKDGTKISYYLGYTRYDTLNLKEEAVNWQSWH